MSENKQCHDCGGSDGYHYDGCPYEGIDEEYSSNYRGRGTNVSPGKWWIGYIVALIIGYGINELLGAIILIGLIVWLMVR